MSINRIQKLLFSEYCDFEDMVLVESPFAQTSRDGKGIKQVHLGLTPSKLILATDIIPPAQESSFVYMPGIDPYIETFELIAVYPIECVNLSVFHRRKRQSLKAHFCNNNVLYFELGGFERRNMFWNLWCERVEFLNPEDPGSSHSETSVATSSTNSTIYLLSSKQYKNSTGKHQIWCNFGAGDNVSMTDMQRWTDKYACYNGKEDYCMNYKPIMHSPSVTDFIHPKKCCRCKFSIPSSQETSITNSSKADSLKINRFASGVKENCSTGLFLPAENCLISQNFSDTTQSADIFTMYPAIQVRSTESFENLMEASVKLWEIYKEVTNKGSLRGRHRRRFGFSPQSHFLHGLGPWSVTPGERFSIQIKRAVSSVNIRRQPAEAELRLPVSKRQLIASISSEALCLDEKINTKTNSLKIAPIRPVIFFWTPEYWYRPRTARDAYLELQNHLHKIREYHHQLHECNRTRKGFKHTLFKRWKSGKEPLYTDYFEHSDDSKKAKTIFSIFSNKDCSMKVPPEKPESSLQYLRKILRMEVAVSAWDFDSTTLAQQLTLIDRDLFLKIPPLELGVLLWQQSSKNAPNIGALIAFSHRISCLIATEVLKDDSEKIRARLIARFINTADKCNKIANFQTCRSILSGLQCPPVYRLHTTWTYVRKRHASKYILFEHLCRLHRDPRLPLYQKTVRNALSLNTHIPFIGDIIAHLLDRIPEYENSSKATLDTYEVTDKNNTNGQTHPESNPNILKKMLSSIKVWPGVFKRHNQKNGSDCRSLAETKHTLSGLRKYKGLIDYYKPLNYYEDNRILKLKEAITLLDKHQKAASNYRIGRNELAREYLLKARYREDKENFINSCHVEPPSQINNIIK